MDKIKYKGIINAKAPKLNNKNKINPPRISINLQMFVIEKGFSVFLTLNENKRILDINKKGRIIDKVANIKSCKLK